MGLTPIEDGSEAEDDRSRGQDAPGVSQRLREAVSRVVGSVVESVVDGVVSAVLPDADAGSRPGKRGEVRSGEGETAIRASRQARLASGPAGTQLPESPPEEPPRNETTPTLESRIRDDTLRIHDPNNRDAYVNSDVYERVRR